METSQDGQYEPRAIKNPQHALNTTHSSSFASLNDWFDPVKILQDISRKGGAIVSARFQITVMAKEPHGHGTVQFPIPGPYREQVPLSFHLHADPPDALGKVACRIRKDGRNWICKAEVTPPAEGVKLEWSALMLIGHRETPELPKVTWGQMTYPDEVAQWTRPTACIQSDDKGIKNCAQGYRQCSDNLEEYVKKVIKFTSEHKLEETMQGGPAMLKSLDAVHALNYGGSCTSRSNLCAALLRAEGIPARTQAHLPTWAAEHYQHWSVEYWHPRVGWTWIEPVLNNYQQPESSSVVLNTSNPKDEDLAFDQRIQQSGVLQGVPLHAVHNVSASLVGRDEAGLANQLRHPQKDDLIENIATTALTFYRGAGASNFETPPLDKLVTVYKQSPKGSDEFLDLVESLKKNSDYRGIS